MNVKTYQCSSCSTTFLTDQELLDHLIEPYSFFQLRRCGRVCFYCSESFRAPADLQRHMALNHSCFSCVQCCTRFYLRYQFEEHMKTHLPRELKALQIYLPGMLPRETFNRFALRLRPDREFYVTCDSIKGRIERFMQNNTSYRRCRILKGGSIGKETDIKEQADVDLIVFLDGYSDMDSYSRDVDVIIDKLKRHIEHGDMNWARNTSFTRRTPFSVQFELTFGSDEVKMPVDLLPAVNVLSDRSRYGRENLYARMKDMPYSMRNYYSSCLSDLQVDFVKAIPSDLKDVIRVIKHWAKIVRQETHCTTVRSYFCELVVIATWMDNGSPRNITTADYVKQVMLRMCSCPSIRIVWPGQYSFHKFVPEMDRPVVLDPANPFRNIAPSRRDAALISRRALELVDNSVKKRYRDIQYGSVDDSSSSGVWGFLKTCAVGAVALGALAVIAGSKQ